MLMKFLNKYLIATRLFTTILLFVSIPAFADIGNTDNGTSSDRIDQYINAARFQASSNMTIVDVKAKVIGITGRYKMAIYNGDVNQPSSLVTTTTEIVNPSSGWYSFSISPTSLIGGQYYWFAVWSDTVGAEVYYTTSGNGIERWETAGKSYGVWPNPLITSAGASYNYCIYATSTPATNPPPADIPPTIITQPQSQTVNQYSNVSFTVSATGTAPITYQWKFKEVNIAGATLTTYQKTNVQPTNSGNYSVSVGNIAGTTNSDNALLTIIPYTPPSTNSIGGRITLTWNPSCEQEVTGYRIYYGVGYGATLTNIVSVYTDSCGIFRPATTNIHHGYTNIIYITGISNTSVTISNLIGGKTYYFAATTYNVLGMESDFSSEISYTTIIANPIEPTNLRIIIK